jgi:two-component system, LytTR family, response regulator
MKNSITPALNVGIPSSHCLKAMIIDDEHEACENLKFILKQYITCNISVAAIAHNTKDAEHLAQAIKPDLVFMDIDMPRENAFDFLQRIQPISFEIIFVTAFDEYAVKAFKLNAIDYILKPINIGELEHAIKKVQERLLHKKIFGQDFAFYNNLLKEVYNKTSIEQFTFKGKDGMEVVPFKDIVFIEAMGSYSKIYCYKEQHEKNFVMSHSIAEYEEILPPRLFYRIHKSYLVNRVHVLQIFKGDAPSTLLSDKKNLPVGRRRLQAFLSFINGRG